VVAVAAKAGAKLEEGATSTGSAVFGIAADGVEDVDDTGSVMLVGVVKGSVV
jgi:hypothetical protein